MGPNTATYVQVGMLIVSIGTTLAAILSARSSKKSKEERQAAAEQQTRENAKLGSEEERISVHAAHEAVRIVEGQRKLALDEARALRARVEQQDVRIEKQRKIIRRQSVRIELQAGQIETLHHALTGAGIDVPPLKNATDDDLWQDEDLDD